MFRALFRVFDYSGRSTRWEYWSFYIGLAIVGILAGVGLGIYQDAHRGELTQFPDEANALVGLAALAIILPSLSLKVRRYHDFGWSGWAVLWSAVPVINIVMELMLLFRGPAAPDVVYADPEQRSITIYNTPGAVAAETGRSHGAHVDQITRLADLHAQGALTAQEFAAAKARVLRS